jgi:glutamate synthase (NADPH/NADH) large chain
MGFATVSDMIGRVDRLDMNPALTTGRPTASTCRASSHAAPMEPRRGCGTRTARNIGLGKALDNSLIADAKAALENGKPVRGEYRVRNVNRTVGAMLSGEVARRYGHAGLAEDTISLTFRGNAGQSFGAFAARGVSLELIGDGNDYVGKGLSGRARGRASAAGSPARAHQEHHRRQHRPLWRDRR